MTDTLVPRGCPAARQAEGAYFRKGCNPFAETGRSKLQNQRAALNQQILKNVRMRTGVENLLRATTNNKVREQALLELSFVNSHLQILKEELEGLNISVEVYQNTQETFSIPLIALGLKETKEVDFAIPLKDFILEHYSEDSSDYEDEIADLMDLREACRTPSRDESGIEMLMSYFIQLSFLENRFFPPTRQMGILFTWYDCFTGVPVCQKNFFLEKASILFNIGALYTQIGTRCNRETRLGLENAVDAFQRAAGILNYLKETFTHTPSYDMSPAMLSVLVKMMLAQAQECVFEKIILPGIRNEFFTLVKMAQEVAKVGEVYMLVNTAMNQTPVKEKIPYTWSNLAKIKSDHYKALAHYFVATLLSDHQLNPSDDEDKQEKAWSQLHDYMPEGLTSLTILRDKVQRKQLGKAHLRKAIVYHEEALRVCGLCKKLRDIDILQEILSVAHKRSLSKYAQHEEEDDFLSLTEASTVVPKTEHKVDMIVPQFSAVKVKDFFEKLGPLPVFSAKQRWTVPRTINFHCQEGELGFALKGGPPVQVHGLDPDCSAAINGLKEGDCIVSVDGLDSKWLGVNEVFKKLKNMGEHDIVIKVISCQDTMASVHKSATYSVGMQKTYSMICLTMEEDKITKTKKATPKLPFLSWGAKNREKAASTLCLPSAVAGISQPKKKFSSRLTVLNTENELY
ncbi:rhophilin-2 isoform X1 [Pelodiscus sinensis]|uniref:rhophilin-2 isoform X1 n=1 Tax=Pelodiscus sinensis TaxID=13735 RepID=UPI0003C4B7D2|nr:rhophilin-2 isoform X1 [Pelodiscus sinensis]|eukprot:XP_006114990.1 rhophilin-2 isoform X1 [Pelodiscus sinensis]